MNNLHIISVVHMLTNLFLFLLRFRNFSLVFATASHQSVRIWSSTKRQELLRIMVPNFSAAAIVFSYDGKSIISAWNDGIIRSFTPLTGRLQYAIMNAHNKGNNDRCVYALELLWYNWIVFRMFLLNYFNLWQVVGQRWLRRSGACLETGNQSSVFGWCSKRSHGPYFIS